MIRTPPFPSTGREQLSFYVVAIFILVCGVFGGSSKADEPLLLIVRLSGVLALLALTVLPSQGVRRRIAPPGILLAALAVTIAVQLVPLPPSIWQSLPGHSRFVDASTLSGIAQPWYPISINPDLTANSLMALLPAIVICLGYARIGSDRADDLIKILCVVGLANVIAGILQLVGGSQSIAYYYARVSLGIISGMFSNRNHFAVYLSLMVPMLLYLVSTPKGQNNNLLLPIAGGVIILFLVIVLASGSRSGTVVFILSTAASAFVIKDNLKGLGNRLKWIAMPLAIAACVVLVLAYAWGRIASIDRIQMLSTDEMRIRSFPVVIQIIRDFFPFGTGFGTFDTVFPMYEPDSMLKPTRFNNAHDDWLEIALTGGLPAFAVTLAFIVWFARAACGVFYHPAQAGSAAQRGRIAAIIIVGAGVASFSDYPLRTPIFTALFAIACCLLSDAADRRNGASHPGLPR